MPQWSRARISEEEEIGMRKCRRRINFGIMNEEVKGSSSEVVEIKIRKCSIKSHIDIMDEEMKVISSEE